MGLAYYDYAYSCRESDLSLSFDSFNRLASRHNAEPMTICPHKSGFVFVGKGGTVGFLSSPEAAWQMKSANLQRDTGVSTSNTIWSVASTGARVIVGTDASGGKISVSDDDGDTWQIKHNTEGCCITNIAVADDYRTILAVGDKRTQTEYQYQPQASTNVICWYLSTDGGDTWESVIPPRTLGACEAVAWNDGKFYVGDYDGSSSCLYSFDPVSREIQTLLTSSDYTSNQIRGICRIDSNHILLSAPHFKSGSIWGWTIIVELSPTPRMIARSRQYGESINIPVIGYNSVGQALAILPVWRSSACIAEIYGQITPRYIY